MSGKHASGKRKVDRRTFLTLIGALALCPPRAVMPARSQPRLSTQPASATQTLLAAPLEVAGDWKSAPLDAVTRVLLRVREVSFSGLKLVSDRQPAKLRVENHNSGPPAIWLHEEEPDTAWIILDVAPAAWSQLAYQFGHELGHVFCNSWNHSSKPRPPTQWLEEAMVEAFSIRGLGLLAASWEKNPPFIGDARYAASIRKYRENYLEEKGKATSEEISPPDLATWFHTHRGALESGQAVEKAAAVLSILPVLESDRDCVEDLGATNRWPARTAIPIEEYLTLWERSCAELGGAGRLPMRLRKLFQLG